MSITQHAPLLLASGSTIRQQMLKGCGLHFSVEPSGVDEAAISAGLVDIAPPQHALTLARAKAIAVSARHPDAYVIGADQLCCLGTSIFSKPGSYDMAQRQLAALSGQTHHQHCGAVIVRGETVVWEIAAQAALTMRHLSKEDIHAYVAADAPLDSCGSYKFESLGRHLFAAVEGDHDVIKGLPLVALLAQLHTLGVIALGS